jgi:hypothetical protein
METLVAPGTTLTSSQLVPRLLDLQDVASLEAVARRCGNWDMADVVGLVVLATRPLQSGEMHRLLRCAVRLVNGTDGGCSASASGASGIVGGSSGREFVKGLKALNVEQVECVLRWCVDVVEGSVVEEMDWVWAVDGEERPLVLDVRVFI